MSASEKADLVSDIIIPTVIIAALFIVNAFVFLAIMRHRKRMQVDDDTLQCVAVDETAAIEMEHL